MTCEPVCSGFQYGFGLFFRLFFGFFWCTDGFAAGFFSALNAARVKPIGMAFNASLLETKWLLILEH